MARDLEPDCINFDRVRKDAERAPRLTSLLKHFEDIASGEKLRPNIEVIPAPDFLNTNAEYSAYYQVYKKNVGAFNHHALASIPFSIEQRVQGGLALTKYAQHMGFSQSTPMTFYGTSSADGSHARSIAEYSNGRIMTLTDSPNESNQKEFDKLLRHKWSYFHLGPFTDITPEGLEEHPVVNFRKGFDVVEENTTFQMYGKNRPDQIGYLQRILKENGVIIFSEKFNAENLSDYVEMENLKDELFKKRYFSEREIGSKQQLILETMEAFQVSLQEMALAIKEYYKHAFITWNSANFYDIAASNCEQSLLRLVSCLGEPYVPRPFARSYPIVRPLY